MAGPIRVDWQAIKARWGSEVSEFHLALVPKGFAQLVLAVQERLQWRATYRVEEYDFSDWDALQEIVDMGLAGLTDTMRLSDLLTILDDVEPLLQELIDQGCCDGDFLVEQQTDPDGVIQPFPDPVGDGIVVGEGDIPGGVEDWETYASRLCDGATKFADGLADWFDVLAAISQLTTIGLAAAVGFLLPALAGVGLVGTSVAGALGALTSLTFLDNLRTILGLETPFATEKAQVESPAVKEAVICAIILSSTPAGAVAAVQSVLSVQAPDAAPFVGWLPLTFIMGRIFNMESDAAGGFGGDCVQCANDFDFIWTFDANAQGWAPAGGGNPSYDAVNDDLKLDPSAFNDARYELSIATITSQLGLTHGVVYHIDVIEMDIWREGIDTQADFRVGAFSNSILTRTEGQIPVGKANQVAIAAPTAGIANFTAGTATTRLVYVEANVISDSDTVHADNIRIAGNIVP